MAARLTRGYIFIAAFVVLYLLTRSSAPRARSSTFVQQYRHETINFTVETNAHEYTEISGADVDGHDIGFISSHDPELMRQACDGLSNCKGFNSNGWLKSARGPRTASDAVLWIKSDTNQKGSVANAVRGTATIHQRWNITAELNHIRDRLRIFSYDASAVPLPPTPRDYKYGAESLVPSLIKSSPYSTSDPKIATAFFVPARCTAARFSTQDRQRGQTVAEDNFRKWINYVEQQQPYWNTSHGSDHFFVCSHDMGMSVIGASAIATRNMIGLVNTADRADTSFVSARDIALPPHVGDKCPTCLQGGQSLTVSRGIWAKQQRNTLAFMAGSMQRGPLRPLLWELFKEDADIELHSGMMKAQEYQRQLYDSEFCLVARGYRVWTPRLLDAVWSGCVPVIIADGYQLPLERYLNWNTFSIRVAERDITDLKTILTAALPRVQLLRAHLLQAAQYLTWSRRWTPGDAFDMVMLELSHKIGM